MKFKWLLVPFLSLFMLISGCYLQGSADAEITEVGAKFFGIHKGEGVLFFLQSNGQQQSCEQTEGNIPRKCKNGSIRILDSKNKMKVIYNLESNCELTNEKALFVSTMKCTGRGTFRGAVVQFEAYFALRHSPVPAADLINGVITYQDQVLVTKSSNNN